MSEIKRVVFCHYKRAPLSLIASLRLASKLLGLGFHQVDIETNPEAGRYLGRQDLALVYVETSGSCQGRKFLKSLNDGIARHAYTPSESGEEISATSCATDLRNIFYPAAAAPTATA